MSGKNSRTNTNTDNLTNESFPLASAGGGQNTRSIQLNFKNLTESIYFPPQQWEIKTLTLTLILGCLLQAG
jgi:hypothetical protein